MPCDVYWFKEYLHKRTMRQDIMSQEQYDVMQFLPAVTNAADFVNGDCMNFQAVSNVITYAINTLNRSLSCRGKI